MSFFNFFNKSDKVFKKIKLETDTLLFLKEGESITEINGENFKKIQFRVIDSLDFEVSKAIEYLEEIIIEKQNKIEQLEIFLTETRNKSIAVLNLYRNTYNHFIVKQKNYQIEIQEFRQTKLDLLAANKTITALNKFQVENNILKQQIKEQDKLIKEYQALMIDDSYELKQAEHLIKTLKNKLGQK